MAAGILNSETRQDPPLWWGFFKRIFDFLINLDSYFAWIPSYFILRVSFLFAITQNLIEKRRRFLYIQAMIGPHIYAGLVYFFCQKFQLDWRFVSVVVFCYFGCFVFQYQSDSRVEALAGEMLISKRKFLKTLIIIKFIFTTWAFLIMGVFVSLP